MSSSFQPSTSGLLANKEQISPLYPDGFKKLVDPLNPSLHTIVSSELATILAQNPVSLYLAPTQSTNLSTIGGPRGTFISFELGPYDLVKIDSIKLSVILTNPSLVNDLYVAPSPCWWNSVNISTANVQSDPDWLEEGLGVNGYHMNMLDAMPREECLKILGEEGFQTQRNDTFQQFISTSASAGSIQSSPALYPGIIIPPGGSRTVSYYLLGCFATIQGFVLSMLKGAQRLSIRFNFKEGAQWLSANGAVTVSDAVLSLEGKRCSNAYMQEVKAALAITSRSVSIPYFRPVAQSFSQTYVAGKKAQHVLTQFVGQFAFLSFALGPSNPATSNTPTTPAGSAQYFQSIAPDVFNVDTVANTVTVGQGNSGQLYEVDNITLKLDGVSVWNTPSLTSQQLNTLAMSCTENTSYLIPQYPGRYLFPFTANLNDVLHGNGFRHGIADLTANASLEFNPINALPADTTLYVFAAKASELLYFANELHVIG